MLETSWRRRESFPLDRPRRTSDSIFKERNTCTFDPAARGARAVHELCPSKDRGRRESRVSDAPAASCAKVESTRVVTTGSPDPSGFPCTMVLTAYFVLSPVTGLFCHRHQRTNVLSTPGRADTNIRGLDASVGAPGPHDFAVRKTPLVRAKDCARQFTSIASRAQRP